MCCCIITTARNQHNLGMSCHSIMRSVLSYTNVQCILSTAYELCDNCNINITNYNSYKIYIGYFQTNKKSGFLMC